MPPYEYQFGQSERVVLLEKAERVILDRYAHEVAVEVERLSKQAHMNKVAQELHRLAPRDRIGIIKMLRLLFNLGLKEAKELMEQNSPDDCIPF